MGFILIMFLMTWSEVFMNGLFTEYQKELLADWEYCLVESMKKGSCPNNKSS
jgi:hypothetical protein